MVDDVWLKLSDGRPRYTEAQVRWREKIECEVWA